MGQEAIRLVLGLLVIVYWAVVLRMNNKRLSRVVNYLEQGDKESALEISKKYGFWLGSVWICLFGLISLFAEMKYFKKKVSELNYGEDMIKVAGRRRWAGAVLGFFIYAVLVGILAISQYALSSRASTTNTDPNFRPSMATLYPYQDEILTGELPCQNPVKKSESLYDGLMTVYSYDCGSTKSLNVAVVSNSALEGKDPDTLSESVLESIKSATDNRVKENGGTIEWESNSITGYRGYRMSGIVLGQQGYGYYAANTSKGLSVIYTFSDSDPEAAQVISTVKLK